MNDVLKEKVEDVLNLLMDGVKRLEEVEKREYLCSDNEHRVRDLEKSIDMKLASLHTREVRLEEEKMAVKKMNEEITRKRESIQRTANEAETTIQEAEEKKKELQIQEKGIDQKIRELKTLIAKDEEFSVERRLIEKEKVVDRQRKELLDIREEKIHNRETQLQINADI